MTLDLTLVLLIVTVAAFVRATVGFGDALLAMPTLALVTDLSTATPLVGLISVSTAAIMLLLSWQALDLHSVLPLLAATVVGIPVGVVVLRRLEGEGLIIVLGVLLVGFGLYRLARPNLPGVRHPALTFTLGLLSGLFGGAYNISGPFVVLYGGLRGWSPEVFRASLQGYFIVSSLIIAASHGVFGLWTGEVWRLYGFALPLTVAAILTGNALANRVPKKGLERLITAAIIVLGIMLIF